MSDHLLAGELLSDALGRVHETVPGVLEGLGVADLLWRPGPDANSIGWLVWHLTRVQDDHVADLVDRHQVWTADGWADRFGLSYPEGAIGYGQSSAEVGQFALTDPTVLSGYHEAVHAMTLEVVGSLSADDYQRVVDANWDPPVTVAVRLVSVVNDVTQHLGQAAYVRGLLQSRS